MKSKVLPFLRIARSMHLTVMDLTVLYEVRSIPGLNMVDLSHRMGVTKGGIHACVYRLDERKLISVRQPQLGKAITSIEIMPAGAAVCQQLEGAILS